MASIIQILNMALGHLGQEPIDTLDLERLREGPRKLYAFADAAREIVIGTHDWLEVQVPINLEPLSITGLYEYRFVYGLPERFVRMSSVAGCADWHVGLHVDSAGNERRVLHASGALSQAWAVIVPKWESLSPQLMLAISLKMADLGCVGVTGGRKYKDDLRQEFNQALVEAASMEGFNHGSSAPDMHGFHLEKYRAV